MKDFKTKDIGLASYLITEGATHTDSKLEDGFVFFYFADVEQCKSMERDYRYNGAKVVARKFNDNIRNLKAEVFSIKNGERDVFNKATYK